MKKDKILTPLHAQSPAGPIKQVAGWALLAITTIAIAYACYCILGIFFGR